MTDTQMIDPQMIDWIELIPFSETRNYVQRVLENAAIYRARRSEAAPAAAGRGA
jgi:soluble lytic murein transglycosylase